MSVTVRCLAGVLLALGMILSVGRADPVPDTEREAAQKAIIDLSNNLDSKDVVAIAKKIVKDHDSCDISSIFTRKEGGGPGIGKLTELGYPDGIERFILQMSRRRTLTEADLEKYREDYLRVARIMQAMAELAPHRATPAILKDEKLAKAWADVSADFKGKTLAFRQAIEQVDPKQARLAAMNLSHTCCACHLLRD
jgi:hypothetical protein